MDLICSSQWDPPESFSSAGSKASIFLFPNRFERPIAQPFPRPQCISIRLRSTTSYSREGFPFGIVEPSVDVRAPAGVVNRTSVIAGLALIRHAVAALGVGGDRAPTVRLGLG